MNRRQMFQTVALGAVAAGTAPQSATSQSGTNTTSSVERKSFVTAKDGTNLHIQDWGRGHPVVLLAAWAFNSTIWGEHIADLTARGFRCVALDRRSHGRSDAPSSGYDLDTLADDVAALFEQRDLRDAVIVGYSMGSIEAVRYLTRHGTRRVRKLVLAAPTTPFMTKTEDNPDAVPAAVIEARSNAIAKDFAKWMAENERPFVVPDTIPETRTWLKAMMLSVPLPALLACQRTTSAADTRAELVSLDLPTLILQGDKDASAPLPLTGVKTAKLIKGSKLVVYEGAPHGTCVHASGAFSQRRGSLRRGMMRLAADRNPPTRDAIRFALAPLRPSAARSGLFTPSSKGVTGVEAAPGADEKAAKASYFFP